MKRLLSVLLIGLAVFSMAACDPKEETKPIPLPKVCEAGEVFENDECVPETITCDEGKELVDGECIIVEETDVTDIRVTDLMKNIVYEGDTYPDFTAWFEVTNEHDGVITITEDHITTDVPKTFDGKIGTDGVYKLKVTYVSSKGTETSNEITIIVKDNPDLDFNIDHYMDTEMSWAHYGESDMDLSYGQEEGSPVWTVNVKKAVDTDWHILIGLAGFEFKAGHTYTYTIEAKTLVEGGRDIGVSFENSDHARLNHDILPLDDSYRSFVGSFTATSNMTGGKFNIFLGDIESSQVGEIVFRQVMILESEENTVVLDNPGEKTWTAPDLTDMDTFVQNLLNTMTIEEKVGQMIQGERKFVSVEDVANYNLGSILNGGGSIPGDDIQDWYTMYALYQQGSKDSSSGIPLIFGTDSVHGMNNLLNATIFPHNIGLGAANDEDLMRRIGEITAIETRLTGISWAFSPAVSIAQDARWGRTYESLSENPLLVTNLIDDYVLGMQSYGLSASVKHFLADGGTSGGKDQGNVLATDAEIRSIHLKPYYAAIEADADTIMISYSSIRGDKMHGSEYWVQTVLKDEMGFEGFIISDYDAIHQLGGSHYSQVVRSINAGIDMLMEPSDWKNAYNDILAGYNNGDISLERINDAVTRILTVKYKRGLFTEDIFRYEPEFLANEDHLAVAREAVRKSLVLLKNDNNVLPVSKDEKIAIIGPGADDIGLLLGGWSLGWQGLVDPDSGMSAGLGQYTKDARVTTILEGFNEALMGHSGTIVSDPSEADTVIVVFAEKAYAEYYGDDNSLSIISGNNAHPGNQAALDAAVLAKSQGKKVVGVLLSGRPLLVGGILDSFDAFVAAWLPGSEGGHGIADVLLGDYNFTGKTPFVWYNNASQFGTNSNTAGYNPDDYLFPYGYGLSYPEE